MSPPFLSIPVKNFVIPQLDGNLSSSSSNSSLSHDQFCSSSEDTKILESTISSSSSWFSQDSETNIPVIISDREIRQSEKR